MNTLPYFVTAGSFLSREIALVIRDYFGDFPTRLPKFQEVTRRACLKIALRAPGAAEVGLVGQSDYEIAALAALPP